MSSKLLSGVISLFVFLVLVIFVFLALRKQDVVVKDFILPKLFSDDLLFDTQNLRGETYIVNIFASWCSTCLAEHEFWIKIKKENSDINLYGIDYLDIKEKAREWLKTNGNPYKDVAFDGNGKMGKHFGLTGVPETFVFGKNGEILLHISGNVDINQWNSEIKQYVVAN